MSHKDKDIFSSSREEHRIEVKEYYNRRNPDDLFNYDQYTSSEHYSPFYGELIADKLANFISEHNICRIVEVGGGRGQLAFDILARLRSKHNNLFKKVQYIIVDISHTLGKYQQKRLAEFNNTRFINASATNLPFSNSSLNNTIIISNEVLADLPSFSTAREDLEPGPVKELVERTGINTKDDKYFNIGTFEFLIEARRVLDTGIFLLIEYGVDEKPEARVLGNGYLNHIEIAINKRKLNIAAHDLFFKVSSGPLIELVGEENLVRNQSKAIPSLPDNIMHWLFDQILSVEQFCKKKIDGKFVKNIFTSDASNIDSLQRIRYWIEKIESTTLSSNRFEKKFLENLTSLFVTFEKKFGLDATLELLYSFQRLHKLSRDVMFESTLRADKSNQRKGEIDEVFFFLLCFTNL